MSTAGSSLPLKALSAGSAGGGGAGGGGGGGGGATTSSGGIKRASSAGTSGAALERNETPKATVSSSNGGGRSGRTSGNRSRNKFSSKDSPEGDNMRSRLHHLFAQIEKEFDIVLAENVALKERVDSLEEVILGTSGTPPSETSGQHKAAQHKSHLKRDSMVTAKELSQKIKSTYKMKTSGKIFNKKDQSNMRGQLLGKYEWHKDGVWFVSAANKYNKLFIATASADGTASICDLTSPGASSTPLVTYVGHQGCSVNCIRFHPNYDLMLTASGDSGAHIWRPNFDQKSSEEEEGDLSQDDSQIIKQALLELSGHSSVVISCDWLSTVDQCVTASWDRTADIYDLHTGELVVQLAGHDQELTDVAAHSSAPLIVTSSHDTTFRLWDFREAIHSVCVFQGHSDCVTSAAFFGGDKVVSGADDRTVKVWDLKNMRSPLTTISVESPINKLGVSPQNNIIAIPLENRNVRLYDSSGNRICRLPRNHHERMVTCATFAPSGGMGAGAVTATGPANVQLFTCAFDRKVCWWSLAPNDKS